MIYGVEADASGRLTAPIVMAGAIARKLLNSIGVEVFAHTVQIDSIKLDKQLPHDAIKRNTYAELSSLR